MNSISPMVQALDITQDGFSSDFKSRKLLWTGLDIPVIDITASNVNLSNFDLHVRDNRTTPIVMIGDRTKMIENITFDSLSISCNCNLFMITNAKNIIFSNCIFTVHDIRSDIFTLSNCYSITLTNCRLSGGNSAFTDANEVTGTLSKTKVNNVSFLFYFKPDSMSKWKVTNSSLNNIQHMIGGEGSSQFITASNNFHSSCSDGLKNGLNDYIESDTTSRDIFSTIGSTVGIGGGSSTPSGGGFGFLSGSYSITQILTFVAIAFVILIIVIVIIVFIVKLAKGNR